MKNLARLSLLVISCPVLGALNPNTGAVPAARKIPKDVSIHADKRIDEYFWLRDKKDPGVIEYLKAENAYLEAVMGPTKGLQEKLYQEMLGHIKEDDSSAAYPRNGYFYYTRTEKGKQYKKHCRKKGSMEAPEEVMLDLNEMVGAGKYIAVGPWAVTDDSRLLAYGIDRSGHRDYVISIRELARGKDLGHSIGEASSLAWANDNDTLFYVVEQKPSKRSYQLWSYKLSTRQRKLLYEEKDELFDVYVSKTRDGKWIVLSIGSMRTSEARYLSASDPSGELRVIRPREEEHRYSVDHRFDRWYIVSNSGAKDFRIMTAPDASPGEWTEFLPHRPGIKVEAFYAFAGFGVAYERQNGLPQLRVVRFEDGSGGLIPMPEPVYDVVPEANFTFESSSFRYVYMSMTTPASTYQYDMASGTRVLIKEKEVPGYERGRYETLRLFAKAQDGTAVPISVVRRKDLRSGPKPLWLFGYGAYGISMPAYFDSNRLSALDRGMVFAVCHVRGGGEMGEAWRDAGRMAFKMNSFTDFIACGEHLVRTGMTTPSRMAATGGSAGGLLMGAVLNLRPDLFRAAVLGVPFVDVLNTMLDASLPLTTAEYIEWGNPNKPEEYKWIREYSPYDNLREAEYPAILVNVSINDSQVPYWEGAKYVAKLRGLNKGSRALLLHSNLDAGHAGAAGRYDNLREKARDYAFILSELGVERPDGL